MREISNLNNREANDEANIFGDSALDVQHVTSFDR